VFYVVEEGELEMETSPSF